METVTLAVPDLTEREQATAIEAALKTISGVGSGRADAALGWVTVAFDPDRIDVLGVVRALQQHHYDVVGLIPTAARRRSVANASRPTAHHQAGRSRARSPRGTPHVVRTIG